MSDSTNNIFAKPTLINDLEIYPVLMNDYEEFMGCANIITYTYDHFNLEEISKFLKIPVEEIKLLDLVQLVALQTETSEETFDSLANMLSIVLRTTVDYGLSENNIYFHSAEGQLLVNRDNYDELREIVMYQNLIFTPKVFKNKITQIWADKVLKAQAKNSANINSEAIITTISILIGKSYEEILNYSYYQVRATFDRICKLKNFDATSIMFANPYAKDIKQEHFAETIEMHKDPYADIFKDENKASKLNGVMGS